MAWAVLHPLCLTLLLSFVMGKIFHTPLTKYAPYIFSGLILWEFIVSSATTGCQALINAEGYIRQFSQPLAIYTLRSSLSCLINLGLAFLGLIVFILASQAAPITLAWISLPLAFLLLFACSWPLATITALITVRFRDFSQVVILILQAIWYVSPVLFLPSVFEQAGIPWLVRYNPVYHILNLVRAPLLEGHFPTMTTYLWTVGVALFLGAIATLFLRSSEKKVIFYL